MIGRPWPLAPCHVDSSGSGTNGPIAYESLWCRPWALHLSVTLLLPCHMDSYGSETNGPNAYESLWCGPWALHNSVPIVWDFAPGVRDTPMGAWHLWVHDLSISSIPSDEFMHGGVSRNYKTVVAIHHLGPAPETPHQGVRPQSHAPGICAGPTGTTDMIISIVQWRI